MPYRIRHVTRSRYTQPVRESITEVRMCPRTDEFQQCLAFHLRIEPRAAARRYTDALGNEIHHFDVPNPHRVRTVRAEAMVEVRPPPGWPLELPRSTWDDVDHFRERPELWTWLQPGSFTHETHALRAFRAELGVSRELDPMRLVRWLNDRMFDAFAYAPHSTRVDSPINEVLITRHGVCQDFAHVFITLLRSIGLPARYVSGYLFHRDDPDERAAPDATHAWLEVYLPEVGWVGLDPTNRVLAGERHIRVALGRDYADVPPLRGFFRGISEERMEVAVRVHRAELHEPNEESLLLPDTPHESLTFAQQQQQQQ